MSTYLATRFRAMRVGAGLTQDEVANRAASWGLEWKPATVTAIEGEQRALSVAELLLLPVILGAPLVDIVAAEGDEVELAPGLVLDGATVRRLVQSGERWDLASPFGSLPVEPPGPSPEQQVLEAERQAARKLGVPAQAVLDVAMWLWGHNLTAQRNADVEDEIRALGADVGARSLQAMRGNVTRRLTAKVEAAIRSGVTLDTIDGPEPEIIVAGHQIPPSELRELIRQSGWMEQAAAKDLGVGLAEVVVVCRWLWGSLMDGELIRRRGQVPLGPDVSARRRQAQFTEIVAGLTADIGRELGVTGAAGPTEATE
jgi:transcriptional regulator with XRE-family HTH domain